MGAPQTPPQGACVSHCLPQLSGPVASPVGGGPSGCDAAMRSGIPTRRSSSPRSSFSRRTPPAQPSPGSQAGRSRDEDRGCLLAARAPRSQREGAGVSKGWWGGRRGAAGPACRRRRLPGDALTPPPALRRTSRTKKKKKKKRIVAVKPKRNERSGLRTTVSSACSGQAGAHVAVCLAGSPAPPPPPHLSTRGGRAGWRAGGLAGGRGPVRSLAIRLATAGGAGEAACQHCRVGKAGGGGEGIRARGVSGSGGGGACTTVAACGGGTGAGAPSVPPLGPPRIGW